MVDQALKTSHLSFVQTTVKVKEVTLCFETECPSSAGGSVLLSATCTLPGEGFGVGMSGLAHKLYSQ